MKYLAQIVSFFVWLLGSLTHFIAKYSDVIDQSISVVAAIIGIAGGVAWLCILRIKWRNEILENDIKKKQLENLNETEI